VDAGWFGPRRRRIHSPQGYSTALTILAMLQLAVLA
jgi:hypothetical protein